MFLERMEGALEGFAKVDRGTLKAFENLNETVLNPKALDRKTKTLMCVAIRVAARFEYCISARVAQAVQAGATREELIETAAVGLMMGGNLAMVPLVTFFVHALNMYFPESKE